MSINYTYEIAAVDQEARCMEIIYTADGHPPQRIGARLPYEGEQLESVIVMYAPLAYWESLQAPIIIPVVGATGSRPDMPVPPTDAEIEAEQNRFMLEQLEFEKRVAQALFKFGLLQSDPTEIPVAKL